MPSDISVVRPFLCDLKKPHGPRCLHCSGTSSLTSTPSPMNSPHPTPNASRSRSLLLLLATAAYASAQVVSPTPTARPATPAAATQDTVQLSPFQVSEEKDIGYASPTAMSGTRTNELLENLPNAISVLNKDLLQDIAANNFL